MTVQEFMVKSGTPSNLRGFQLIEMAIEKVMEKPNANMTDIVQEVADDAGLCWGTTYNQIRKGIVTGFPEMDRDVKKHLFKRWLLRPDIPPLKEYITTVAYALKRKVI